jgi:UrcA family protein
MTRINSALRHSCAALAAAGALAGALASPAGSAAAQSAYQSQITSSPLPAYQAPSYQPPSYRPQAAYAPPPNYATRADYPPPPSYEAQPGYPPPPAYRTVEQMTIIAPGVHRRTVGRSDTGIPVEELSLSRVVDISDLDLSRQQDVDMMDYRVRMAALRACGELDREYPQSLYPSYPSSDDGCVTRATNEGIEQERQAVAAAEAIAYSQPPYPR